jgi:4'-phosphopantetheinyl transferase
MIELWLVDLEAAQPSLAALEGETPRLSPDDIQRAGRLQDAGEQRHRLAAYTAVRVALERLGGPAVRQLAYSREGEGKPTLAGVAPAFSLSHTGSAALIGVSRQGAIGVDVEKDRPLRIAPRRRQEIVAAASGLARRRPSQGCRDRDVLQAWSRLEAYAKARGQAVGRVLSDLGLRTGARHALPLEAIGAVARAQAQGLTIIDLALPAGLLGAVAIGRGCRRPPLMRFPSDLAALRCLLPPP